MVNRQGHGEGDDVDWCSIAEAARRLGVTPTAIRNPIKRGTLKTRLNGNYGHLVHVPKPEPVSLTVSGTVPEQGVDTVPLTVSERSSIEIELRAQVAALYARVDELREDAERERAERLTERERANHLADEVADTARQMGQIAQEAMQRERELRDQIAEAGRTVAEMRARPWWRRLAG